MKFKLPFQNKQEIKNYYLNLILEEEKISAIILEEALQKVALIAKGEDILQKSIEDLSEEELLSSLDKVISSAEETLPKNVETHKTVFGLKESWIEDGKIKKDYLLKLKKACQELALTPIGFLVTPEAIAHLLAKEEGAPISAILTEVGKQSITITLIRAGRIIENKISEIKDSPSQTLDDLLKHLTNVEILPSRIIISSLDGKDLTQEFNNFSWSKSLPFLHMPQISSLSEGFEIKSVAFGTANQLGMSLMSDSINQTLSKSPIPELSETEFKEKPDKSFGFLENEDISKQEDTEEEIKQERQVVADNIEEIPTEIKIRDEETTPLPNQANFLTTGYISTINKIKKIRLLKSSKIPKGRAKLLLIIPAVLVLILLIFVWTLFNSRANIILGVNAKSVDQTETVTFSSTSSTDPTNKILTAGFPTVSEDGKMTADATGQKETGDKAKGTVTVFNLSSSSRTIASGTTIVGPNNLKFILDNSVTVASQSGDASSPTPGTSNVSVTAANFGSDYNFPSGTKFSVADFSTSVVVAKNDNPFNGGTSKKITIVSADDLKNLSNSLLKDLESKARTDIAKNNDNNTIVMPDFVDESFDTKDYSKKVGDEASSVNLTATVSFKSVSYKKDDLANFAKSLFEKQLDGNLTINPENVEAEVDNLSKKGEQATASVKFKANLIPKIDNNSMANNIKGKSLKDAQALLSSLPEVTNVNIKISPVLPFLPQFIPKSSDKIKIYLNLNE